MEGRGIVQAAHYKWQAVLTTIVPSGSIKFADFLTSWETRSCSTETERQTDSQSI